MGHINKYVSHRFLPGAPRGFLHRAFSVFLFDQDANLLLQKVREKALMVCTDHRYRQHGRRETCSTGTGGGRYSHSCGGNLSGNQHHGVDVPKSRMWSRLLGAGGGSIAQYLDLAKERWTWSCFSCLDFFHVSYLIKALIGLIRSARSDVYGASAMRYHKSDFAPCDSASCIHGQQREKS